MTQLSESQRRSLAAIGDSCVIPAKAGIQWRFRVIPAKAGIQRRWKTLDSRFRGNDAEVGAHPGIQWRFRVIPAKAGIQSLATNDAGFPLSRERRHSVP